MCEQVPLPALTASLVPLGDVIAERRFTLYEAAGEKRQIDVRIGRPVATGQDGAVAVGVEEQSIYRCPLQITGLDCDEQVFAPFGGDPFVALQYAIHLAGDILDRATERLNLVNRLAQVRDRYNPGGPHFEDAGRSSWIWHYDSRPDMD